MRYHTLLEVLFIIAEFSDFPENFIEVSLFMLFLSAILFFIRLKLVLVLLPVVWRLFVLSK